MVILGIHDGHCASAALIVNGKLIASISEERLVRRKMEWCFPINAVNECLKIANLKLSDIDKISYSSFYINPIHYLTRREATFKIEDWLKEQNDYWYPKFYLNKKPSYKKIFSKIINKEKFPYDKKLIKNENDSKGMLKARKEHAKKFFKKKEIEFFDHQECHAFHVLSFDKDKKKKKLVFSIDGAGDGANAVCWLYDPKKTNLKQIVRTDKCNIGRLYRFITLLLGMLPVQHEYKVMGLAPYANKKYSNEVVKIFLETLDVKGINFYQKKKIKDLFFYFKDKLSRFRFDSIAYGIQNFTEIILTKWITNLTKKFKVSDICISGGVAQNIKANLVISNLKSIKNILVAPGSGDEGLAIGAAYRCFFKHCNKKEKNTLVSKNPYLGNSHTDYEIEKIINKTNLRKNFIVKKITKKGIAKLLANEEIVGIFSGKMEFGPRALGNRSIIANPSNFQTIKTINEIIKQRDFWMPFAPSIMSNNIEKYLKNGKKISSRFMTVGCETTKLAKKHLAAAIHPYDGTVRPHIVYKEDNPEYYEIIDEFKKMTGIGAVLNTSFNLHGEPIVCRPKDAIKTFKNSGLNCLVLNSYLIKKKN